MKKQITLALPLGGTLALVVLVVAGLTGSADEKPKKPTIKRLGTIDLLMVETTPVVFKDRLYRFEYVRDNYPANKTGASYFRFIDVATGKATPAFAKRQHLGCAFVEGDTVYAFGVDKWGGSKITVFWSKDMEKWEERLALHLSGWELFNTSVCKADGRYVMAVEVGAVPAASEIREEKRRSPERGQHNWSFKNEDPSLKWEVVPPNSRGKESSWSSRLLARVARRQGQS